MLGEDPPTLLPLALRHSKELSILERLGEGQEGTGSSSGAASVAEDSSLAATSS